MSDIEQPPVSRSEDRTGYFNRLNSLMHSRFLATAIEPCGDSAILWALCGGIWPTETANLNRPPHTRSVVYGLTTPGRTALRALVRGPELAMPLDVVYPPIDATAYATNPADDELVTSCIQTIEDSTYIPGESLLALQAIRKNRSLLGNGTFAEVARTVAGFA